jgi:hypothetical protein
VAATAGLLGLNWAYQVARKPGEIFAPISAAFSKTPETTWRSYRDPFEKHSTSIVSPELLAALAQVESGGNPVASAYWTWQWSWNPLEIYRPASSALGLFQITDGTFAAARNHCVRHARLTGADDSVSCARNAFYTRIVPALATEMTAAHLHRSVDEILARRRGKRPTLAQTQKLAAVVHLCGKEKGARFAQRGFRVSAAERCGSHGLARYLADVELLRNRFAALRQASRS